MVTDGLTQFGAFRCLYCFTEWEQELPWIGDVEEWPSCCEHDARLMTVCAKDEQEGED